MLDKASQQLRNKKYELLTDLYLRMVKLNTDAFFPPDTKMGEYCELLIIVKTILNRQVKNRSTKITALARAIEISRTTLYRRLLRLTEMGMVNQSGASYVLSPRAMDSRRTARNVERLATVVENVAKKLSNLEHSPLH